jgi:hypothetical protein
LFWVLVVDLGLSGCCCGCDEVFFMLLVDVRNEKEISYQSFPFLVKQFFTWPGIVSILVASKRVV